ncbi:DUF1799 domain-containing protein [uncultured Xanthomonas sp.]|uniref:DUF1799 domain-containing protein n=1 Tax=uncultured Xanthomonas sp. TaxID=152831 RepID=UPI0025F328EE|nr:DUF1799 domain-containing protein [uncultured Xanthomonas sp.]
MRDGGTTEDAAEQVDVLEENWQALMVFRQCRPQWITGMHAPLYDGISALEIEAAARLHRVAEDDYPDLIASIEVLVRATRQARNEPTA